MRRDREIRDERVHSHLGLAHQLARRFGNRGETHDDLVQVASLALVRAAERFDPDRGVMFSTFAAASIIGELKRHFRDRGWAVRAPRRLQEMVLEIGSATDRLGQELGRAPTVPELAKEIGASETDILEALEAGQSYRTSSLDARDREGQSMAESLGSEDSGFVGVENHSALAKAMGTLSPRRSGDRPAALRRRPDPVGDRRPARCQPDADQPSAGRQLASAPLEHRRARRYEDARRRLSRPARSHDTGAVTEPGDGYITTVTALLPGGDTPAPAPGTAPAPPTLQVELDVQGPRCLLMVRGELCGGSLSALAAQVDRLGCLPCEQVVVDLRRVTRLDQAGAKVILGLYYYVLGRGGALRVTGMVGPVEDTLRAAGAELVPRDGLV